LAADTGRLVRLAREGDSVAFEQLVHRHLRAAYAVALAITGDADDAEDVAQDSFVVALERLDDCADPERFSAWLLKIVRNRALNWRRSRARRATTPLHEVVVPANSDPERDTERVLLRERLMEEIATLTELQRQVLLLHDLEGYRHREVAEVLGISEVSSRVHLFAARRALKSRLNGRYKHEGTGSS
jgi:RNA polymerase sigma-70 factor (ECF subfamily)